MNGLLLLKEPADWEKFKAELMVTHGIDRSAMTWGSQSSPTSYPCLSSGVIVNSSVVCVFVYVDDAKKLLDVITAHPEEIDFGGIVPEVSETGWWIAIGQQSDKGQSDNRTSQTDRTKIQKGQSDNWVLSDNRTIGRSDDRAIGRSQNGRDCHLNEDNTSCLP